MDKPLTHAIIDRVRAVNATASLRRLGCTASICTDCTASPTHICARRAAVATEHDARFVNDAHHFAKGKVAPTHVRYRWVTDLVSLPCRRLPRRRCRLVVVLNDGMVENVQGNDDARAASTALTESTAAMTSAFLAPQGEVAPTAELLLVESPPQHFATPSGLYRPGDRQLLMAARRGAIDGADAANGTALLATCNWRRSPGRRARCASATPTGRARHPGGPPVAGPRPPSGGRPRPAEWEQLRRTEEEARREGLHAQQSRLDGVPAAGVFRGAARRREYK